MLYRKLLMVGASSAALSSHWILPGGHIISLAEDGSLAFADPDAGWPLPVESGDPFVDAEGRIGTYELLNVGGGVGEARSVRLRDSGADREEVRSLGPFRGFASANVAASLVTPGTETNPFGFSRPSWRLTSVTGGDHETGYTADWAWEQQSNGTSSGESTLPADVQVIQEHYTPNMAYPWGVCVSRDLAVVTRLEATANTGAPDGTDPSGRPWIGWTMDAAGVARRIADLTPAQARQLGHDANFLPDDGEIITKTDQAHEWLFLRPIGPFGLDSVMCTGVLRYAESYSRVPTTEEKPYFMRGRAAFESSNKSEPLLDAPMDWFHDPANPPVTITERRVVLMFCTVLISAAGIVGVTVTGSSAARSVSVTLAVQSGSPLGYKVLRKVAGGYDVIWSNHPQYAHYHFHDDTFDRTEIVSPNGWKAKIVWPVWRQNTSGDYQHEDFDESAILRQYMPIWWYANQPDAGIQPPTKPADWDDDTQGAWTVPPQDLLPAQAWRGQRYWIPTLAEYQYQNAHNNIYTVNNASVGAAASSHALLPNGPYPRDGARQYRGEGEFPVARHQDGSFSSHEAGRIVPGIVTGPGGALKAYAEPDDLNPEMRDLRWPGRPYRLAMTQDGQWSFSSGGGWSPISSFGQVEGTISVAARLEAPESPDPVS